MEEKNNDILAGFDLVQKAENSQIKQAEEQVEKDFLAYNTQEDTSDKVGEVENIEAIHSEIFEEILLEKTQEDIQEPQQKIQKSFFEDFSQRLLFLVKYLSTSTLIFALLMVTANYSAYINIAKGYIYQEEMVQSSKKLITSVAASELTEEKTEEPKEETPIESMSAGINPLDIHNITAGSEADINLNIEITPYENRIVIPRIGKNIPLVDVEKRQVADADELNDIFMEELENGVVRYPGSAKPGVDGNTFIFGHSSNLPWVKGDYNDVFALLDKVVYEDDIILYYGQKKFRYKVREKKIISPGEVGVIKQNRKKNEVTLMTCWPIGTTLNRLIVTGDLIEE